jgi:hypothetical protein
MSGTGKFEDLHLDDLSLEPLPDPNLLKYEPPRNAAGVADKAAFQADVRNKKELRFEPDRRSGKERRPRKTWDPSNSV